MLFRMLSVGIKYLFYEETLQYSCRWKGLTNPLVFEVTVRRFNSVDALEGDN